MPVFGVILVRIFPAFSRIRTEYGEILRIAQYSVRMRENAGKCGPEQPVLRAISTMLGRMDYYYLVALSEASRPVYL